MNEVMKAIHGRRSIRNFQDKKIEKEKIKQIINAGLLAPSARNLQPWRFVAVTNKELIKEMDRVVREKVINKPMYSFVKKRAETRQDVIFYSAPLLVFILGDKKNHWSPIDCSLAAENMMLAAYSLGIGSCPVGMARFLVEDKEIVGKLGFPDTHELVLTLVFGYSDERPGARERKKEVVRWIEEK